MFCHDGVQKFLMDYDFFRLLARVHATEQYTSEFRTNFIDIISVRVSPTCVEVKGKFNGLKLSDIRGSNRWKLGKGVKDFILKKLESWFERLNTPLVEVFYAGDSFKVFSRPNSKLVTT